MRSLFFADESIDHWAITLNENGEEIIGTSNGLANDDLEQNPQNDSKNLRGICFTFHIDIGS